jgi:hypothetical protein
MAADSAWLTTSNAARRAGSAQARFVREEHDRRDAMALSVTRQTHGATGRWWLVPEGNRPALTVDAAAAMRWALLRGQEQAHFTAELFGGFPGAAHLAGRSGKVRLSISDRYLIANDGASDGFALPLASLRGMSLVPSHVAGEPAVRLRYYLDGTERTMILCVHHRRTRTLRRERQIEQFINALARHGVPGLAPVDPEQRLRLALTWEEARAYAGETIVWNGEASAPVGGWLGQDRAPCRAWLTTKALYWGTPTGHGINRLALEEIEAALTAAMPDRDLTPVVVIAIRDLAGDRLELPFVFDQPAAGINQRDRGAFTIGLRSQGIDVTAAPPRPRPWSAPPSPTPTRPAERPANDAPAPLPPGVKDLSELVVPVP